MKTIHQRPCGRADDPAGEAVDLDDDDLGDDPYDDLNGPADGEYTELPGQLPLFDGPGETR